MTALLRVSTDGCVHNDGTLTQWHAESQLQRYYYGLPCDDYDVQVSDAVLCEAPEIIMHKLSRRRGSGGLSRISVSFPLFRAHWADCAGDVRLKQNGVTVRAAEQLQRWGVRCSPDDVPVLLLPRPIAYLVMKASWSRLLCLAHWHETLNLNVGDREARRQGPVAGWPPDDSRVWGRLGESAQLQDGDGDEAAPSLTRETLKQLADQIRAWAPAVGEEIRRQMERSVNVLDQWGLAWEQSFGTLRLPGSVTRFRHSARKMLECIRLANRVRGGSSKLLEVIARALATALPGFLQKDFLDNVDTATDAVEDTTPSSSLILRHES